MKVNIQANSYAYWKKHINSMSKNEMNHALSLILNEATFEQAIQIVIEGRKQVK